MPRCRTRPEASQQRPDALSRLRRSFRIVGERCWDVVRKLAKAVRKELASPVVLCRVAGHVLCSVRKDRGFKMALGQAQNHDCKEHVRLGSLVTTNSLSFVSVVFTSSQRCVILLALFRTVQVYDADAAAEGSRCRRRQVSEYKCDRF